MDESMLKNLEGLPAEDQMRMANMIEQLQLRDRSKMDESMLKNLEGLPAEDQMRMANMIEQLQLRDSLRMYNAVVERCFTDCVDSFRRKSLDKGEEACVRRCTEKFLKHSMRVGLRFAELNQGAATQD